MTQTISSDDQAVVVGFTNFLSWQMQPAPQSTDRPCPPAVWAYMLGATRWCPPKGEL